MSLAQRSRSLLSLECNESKSGLEGLSMWRCSVITDAWLSLRVSETCRFGHNDMFLLACVGQARSVEALRGLLVFWLIVFKDLDLVTLERRCNEDMSDSSVALRN